MRDAQDDFGALASCSSPRAQRNFRLLQQRSGLCELAFCRHHQGAGSKDTDTGQPGSFGAPDVVECTREKLLHSVPGAPRHLELCEPAEGGRPPGAPRSIS